MRRRRVMGRGWRREGGGGGGGRGGGGGGGGGEKEEEVEEEMVEEICIASSPLPQELIPPLSIWPITRHPHFRPT